MAVVLVFYTMIAGLLFHVPTLPILHETIRNLYFHVPMWMGMLTVFVVSVYFSIKYLQTGKEEHDLAAVECVNTGLFQFHRETPERIHCHNLDAEVEMKAFY